MSRCLDKFMNMILTATRKDGKTQRVFTSGLFTGFNVDNFVINEGF
jgi:hypothetical protein